MSIDEATLAGIERNWCTLCAYCDAGLATSCTCPNGDPRKVIACLVAELRGLADQGPHCCPPCAVHTPDEDARQLAEISAWVDYGNRHRSPEAITWGRLAKVTEETGEVIEAWIGATGQNPRKGVTHDERDVGRELLDVALTALAAVEHLTGNEGRSMGMFSEHVRKVAARSLTSSGGASA